LGSTSYQTKFGDSTSSIGSDGFIAKFSSNGAIKWATYFGGPDDDQSNGIAIDGSGFVYITGITKSTSGIATNSAFSTSLGGYYDMFLTKFDSIGRINWATYYGGEYNDNAESIALDKSGNIYVGGYTESHTGIATSGAFQTSHYIWSFYTDACLIKFDGSGSVEWGTYYGDIGGEEIYSITTDDSGYVYMAGYAANNANVATPDAYQTSCNGGGIFFAKFNANCRRIYGTYYVSGTANGISVDRNFNIYITGYTPDNTGFSTYGVYQRNYGGGVDDGFLTKFTYLLNNDAGINAIQNPNIICPGNYPVVVNLKNYGKVVLRNVEIFWAVNEIYQGSYSWTGDLKSDSISIVNIGSFNFKPGRDTIMAWTYYPNGATDSAIYNDSARLVDTIYQVPAALVRSNHNVCEGTSFSLGNLPVSGNQYLWSSVPSGFTSTISNPVLTLTQVDSLTYILKETNPTGCSTVDSTKIIVSAPPIAYAGTNATICAGKSEPLGKSPISGSFYSWTSDPEGFTSFSANPVIEPLYNTKYILSVINLLGCTSSDSVIIYVNPSPVAYAGNNSTICQGNYAYIGTPGNVGGSCSWEYFPPGSILNSQAEELLVKPTMSMTYVLTVTNSFGCSNSDTVKVTVNNMPDVYTGPSKTICSGTTDTLGKAPQPGNKYFWYTLGESFISDSANPAIIPNQTTKYYLSVINAAGCYKLDSVLINVVPGVNEINAGQNYTICSGTSVNLGEAPASGYSYSWRSVPVGFTSISSDTQIVPLNTATYILTKTANKGCSKADSVTIKVNSTPVAYAGMDTHICEGSQVILGSAKVTGEQYRWYSLPYGFSSNAANPDVIPDATTIYILTETSDSGCSKTDSVTVDVIPSPESDPGKSQTICAGSMVSLGVPPTIAETYFWSSNPQGFDSTSSNPTVRPDTTTIYTVTTFGRTGCSKRASVTITVNPSPNTHWKTVSRCNIIRFLPQDSFKSFIWYFGDGSANKTDTAPLHIYNTPGSYSVKLVAVDSIGCTSTSDSTIDINCTSTNLNFAFYPNPFHADATFQYHLYKTSKVTLSLVDAIGKEVFDVVDKTQDAGEYSISIDAKKMSLAPGVYFLIFRSDEGDKSLKVINL